MSFYIFLYFTFYYIVGHLFSRRRVWVSLCVMCLHFLTPMKAPSAAPFDGWPQRVLGNIVETVAAIT